MIYLMRLGFLVLFIGITIGANSQIRSSLIDGFLVTNDGDTLVGKFKIKNPTTASRICFFILPNSSKVEKKIPDEIKLYRLSNGKYYVTKDYETKGIKTKVFMEYLLQGKVDIYYFRDNSGDHYFIEKEGEGRMIELSETPEIYNPDYKIGIYNKPSLYKGKLNSLLSDCDKIKPFVEQSKIDHESLISLGKTYHDFMCNDYECIIYSKGLIKPHVQYEFVSKVSLDKFNFGNKLITDMGKSIALGVNFDIQNISVSNDKFSLKTGILLERNFNYTLYSYQDNESEELMEYEGEEYRMSLTKNSLTITELDIEPNITSLRIPILVNYNMNFSKTKLVGGIGASTKFNITKNSTLMYRNSKSVMSKAIPFFMAGGECSVGLKVPLNKKIDVISSVNAEYVIDPFKDKYSRANYYQFGIQLVIVFN